MRAKDRKTVALVLLASAAALAVVLALFGDFRLDFKNDRFHPRPSAAQLSSAYARDFSSTLPVVYIQTDEKAVLTQPDETVYPRRGEATCELMVFDDGENALTDEPSQTYTNVRVKIRGRSSSTYEKRPYAVEFRDESGNPIERDFLGFDAESDFVLHAPYIDKSGLRNYLAYTLAGELMGNAPACRLVEVFITDGDAPLEEADYAGIYLAVEKIKADSNTVGVTHFERKDTLEKQIADGGGYIIRRDKYDEGTDDVTILPATFQRYEYQVVFPKPLDLSEGEMMMIHHETMFFEDLVYYDTFAEMEKYIDIDSFVSAIMINEFTRNTEAFEGSAYFYRDVGGKFTAGPVWDFDLSLSNAALFFSPEGTTYTEKRLEACYMEHPEFMALFVEKWFAQRAPGGTFSDEHLLAVFDGAVAQMGAALERNARRYPALFDGTTDVPGNIAHYASYEEELAHLREFMIERAAWMDAYFGAI